MCARAGTTQGRQGRPDRRGGTSRTGAKRAGECDGLTGLPEANAGGPGPQATVPTCAGTTRFRAPGCGSSPTETARRSPPLSRPICTAPHQEAAWQALTDFSESDMGVKHPSVGDDLGAGLGAIHPFFLDSPADAQACHLSPTSWEVPPPPTVSRLRATSCARITDEPRPLPLSMRRRPELAKAGDLRHPWTNEPENATRTKDCHHPSARPRADSSKDRSPPTRYKGPGPAPPPPTPTESTPTCKTLTQKTGR